MSYFIDFDDILSYLGDNNPQRKRNYVEGNKVVNANHFMYVGIISDDGRNTEIIGLCLQTSDLYGNPHELQLHITQNNGEKIISLKCSCYAGLSGNCKHCIGLLFYLCRYVFIS